VIWPILRVRQHLSTPGECRPVNLAWFSLLCGSWNCFISVRKDREILIITTLSYWTAVEWCQMPHGVHCVHCISGDFVNGFITYSSHVVHSFIIQQKDFFPGPNITSLINNVNQSMLLIPRWNITGTLQCPMNRWLLYVIIYVYMLPIILYIVSIN
jgi:hypothetical protein